MEGLIELVPSLVKEGDAHMWDDFLKACNELRVFAIKSSESVSLINSLLNEPDSRYYGLKLLEVFVTQCAQTAVNAYIIQWFHQSFKGMSQPLSKSEYRLSCNVISTLLEKSIEFPDVRKHVSQVLVPKILDSILEKLLEGYHDYNPVMNCLFYCLRFYGKSCGNHRERFESLLISLTLSDRYAIRLVSKCFHLLAQTGAPGAESVNYKHNWHSQQLIIINSLHSVLDQFFSGVDEILGSFTLSSIEKRKLNLPVISCENLLVKSHKLSLLFTSLCQFLEGMLLNAFPTSKKIHPEAIFSVICRALAVSCKSLEVKISNATYAVMSCLTEIHISVIRLFNSLLVCSRSNLLPFSSLICKLFIQIFKWSDTEDGLCGREKVLCRVRQASYKCLLTWLTIAKSCSLNETQINIIVDAIVKDIKCDKKVVKLNLEKKTQNKFVMKTASMEAFNKMEMNVDTCRAALACIPLLVRNPLPFIIVKKIQEVVVKIIFEIQRMLRSPEGYPQPYSDPSCRRLLYSVLLSLCTSPHPHFPPPLHYANVLFNTASLDCDVEVQRVCANAANDIAHLIRPCAPSFDFHIELDSEIIPINPYPELAEKECKSPFKCSNNKLPSHKLLNDSSSKKQYDTSKQPDIEKISTSNVTHKKPVSPCSNSEPKFKGKNECIDLNDSSDESIIFVDSEKKTRVAQSNNSRGNKCSKIVSVKCKTLEEMSADTIIDKYENEVTVIQSLKQGPKTPSFTSCSADMSINIDNYNSSESVKTGLSKSTSTYELDSCKTAAEDIIEIDEPSDVSIPTNSSEEKPVITEQSKLRRSLRGNKWSENNVDSSNSSAPPVVELVDTSPTRKRRRSALAKSSTQVTDTSHPNNVEYENQISEDVCIIELAPISPLTRSRRLNKLSVQSNTNENGTSKIEDVTTITDEDEPEAKGRKADKHCLIRPMVCDNNTIVLDKHIDNQNNDSPICDVDIDNEDEMLNSFVDSVA